MSIEENGLFDDLGVPETNEVWKKITAWCPLCWWKYGPEEFHVLTNAAPVRRRMILQHRKDRPNCDGRIRIEEK